MHEVLCTAVGEACYRQHLMLALFGDWSRFLDVIFILYFSFNSDNSMRLGKNKHLIYRNSDSRWHHFKKASSHIRIWKTYKSLFKTFFLFHLWLRKNSLAPGRLRNGCLHFNLLCKEFPLYPFPWNFSTYRISFNSTNCISEAVNNTTR